MSAITLAIVQYTERVLSSMHRSAVKTLTLLMGALAVTRNPNLSEWARTLWLYRVEADGTKKAYGFATKKFRIWRFLAKSVFAADEIWESITHELLDVRDVPEDRSAIRVTLDWTDLGDFAALVLAIPYRGRALPLAVEAVPKAFLDQMMTDLEIGLVQRFLGWLSPALRSRIVILADRGFAKVELMEAIEEAGAFYVTRLRRDARIRRGSDWIELQSLGILPGENRLYPSVRYTQEHEKELHVAIRRLSVGKANDPDDDTWYLATNWEEPGLAAPWYSRRFRIEEMFKDLKSMLDLAGHQMKEEEGLVRLVAVVGLYYTFVILHGQVKTTVSVRPTQVA